MTREEVINGLYDIKNWKCNGDAEMYKTIVEAIQALKQPEHATANELPSVTPKRKTGKWIKDDFTGIIKCNQCGNDSPMDTTGGGQYESNFCPNCGADMRSEAEQEVK